VTCLLVKLANARKGHEGVTKVAVGLDGEGHTGIAGIDAGLVLGHVLASRRAAVALGLSLTLKPCLNPLT
jgi:hypothetical protein